MWSEHAPVPVMTYRMLGQFSSEVWAQDLLSQLYLDETLLEWARDGLPFKEETDSSTPTLDSNGTRLNNPKHIEG